MIYKNKKKIYFLSGTTQSNTILFGNDYLINLDKKNKVLKTQKLHSSLLIFNIRDKDGSTSIGGAHTHILDDFQVMTVTDICALMLYQHMTKWEYYAVVSKKYLSFWDSKKQELRIIINNDKNFDALKDLMTSAK